MQRSTNKVKENHCDIAGHEPLCPILDVEGRSYKDKLVGECPGAFGKAFDFENTIEMEAVTDDEADEDRPGEATIRLTRDRKGKIQAAWKDALIVKVFGKTIGYHFLISRLISFWKPVGKMDCIDLGNDFFLIRFSIMKDRARVLKDGPWFVGGHYLSIRCWEPNFMAAIANLSVVAVWIRLPSFPIEYYEPSVLRDIGLAIGPMLKIDT